MSAAPDQLSKAGAVALGTDSGAVLCPTVAAGATERAEARASVRRPDQHRGPAARGVARVAVPEEHEVLVDEVQGGVPGLTVRK